MTEREKAAAWRLRGKGKGLRWHIQREIVGFVSRKASNTTDVQSVMTMMRGISHKKTEELLRELQTAKCVVQEHDKHLGYYWIATSLGVHVYLGNMTSIPVQVAEALLSSVNVNESGESNNETGER